MCRMGDEFGKVFEQHFDRYFEQKLQKKLITFGQNGIKLTDLVVEKPCTEFHPKLNATF